MPQLSSSGVCTKMLSLFTSEGAQIMVTLFPDEHCDTDGQPGYKSSSEEGGDGHRRLRENSGWWGSWWSDR